MTEDVILTRRGEDVLRISRDFKPQSRDNLRIETRPLDFTKCSKADVLRDLRAKVACIENGGPEDLEVVEEVVETRKYEEEGVEYDVTKEMLIKKFGNRGEGLWEKLGG